MKIQHLATSILLLQLAACNRPPPAAPEGEDPVSAEEEDDGPPVDLPCGGADLQTDDRNCGSCGNECYVWWPGTEYEAGGCVDGACGPMWSDWSGLPPPPDTRTCEQICAYGGVSCAPRGCAGMTALVCGELSDFGNMCDLGDPSHHAMIAFSGECAEPIPYPKDSEEYWFINYTCCCDF